MTSIALGLIRLYQRFLSPIVGPACRFEPTCSRYAYEAIERHGVGRGVWLAAKRLARCRPGGATGYDPVPPSEIRSNHGHPTGRYGA
jgi:putative membrane protein insertion efficiency factor